MCTLGGSRLTACCIALASDASKRLTRVEEALRRRAGLWIASAEGVFPPRDGPVLLDRITDALLVLASDVVTSEAAAAPIPISGKARLRLLTWLLADAQGVSHWGVDVHMDKPAAEKVGKRLERQAHRVRDELAAAREAAATDRARVEAQGGDAAILAAIDTALQQTIDHAHNEVYVGFTELDSLMLVADPEPELEPVLEPEPKAEPPVAARP